MSTAREHAIIASELLDGERALEARLDNVTEEERLQMIATGQVGRINADRKFAVDVALAHALTALAMAQTEEQA